MTSRLHANAPLSPEERRRLVERCRTRPIAHVAEEMGVSRATASKWVSRYERFGDLGLRDRSPAPFRQPSATPGRLVEKIQSMRRKHGWSASRIALELDREGTPVSRRTVSRLLAQLGLHAPDDIDPRGATTQERERLTATRPGHIVQIDARRVGSANADEIFLHSAVDRYSEIAYAETLPDDAVATVIAFLRRAKASFAAQGIPRIERVVTPDGACYRTAAFREALGTSPHPPSAWEAPPTRAGHGVQR
ncbi:helix-turn-helix domain-containing protein [Microbacterium sp. MYb62]|uniref:helix-turn-helix domain-containing protein n=1 Tax=Microbacterium sp. MYb62 TaxID=1848690 RepID=UPI000CFB262F|nr:helix-turn-helix domain-containing protein [Microbacterium sp. MYb62]PRB14115.1 hypothetical protein CQ042_11545 [Microbacterium sp. MYb62]